jgi:hypothetical protein
MRGAGSALLALLLGACATRDLPSNDGRAQSACCDGHGMCLPPSFLESNQAALLGQGSCQPQLYCVPNELRSQHAPKACRTADGVGAEGRCLPACLPKVQSRGDQLTRSTCEEQQRCVPCYDPITGESSGACSIGDDPGPSEPPATFAPCCGQLGVCVPQGLVPAAQQSLLGQDSCKAGALCAPRAVIEGGATYAPPACTTLGFGSEGRCLPSCLPPVAAQSARLGQSSCGEHELCAPCTDPIKNQSTGSCSLGADHGPAAPEAPVQTCCGGLGHCLPDVLLKQSEREQLGPDSCSAAQTLCVPDAFAAPDFRPATCTASAAGVEGRCLPACLPQLGKQLDRLHRDGCAELELCAPCVDPISGMATGACTLGADSGPSGPPQVFGSCCGGAARCVPDGSVPEQQRTQLARESCGGEHELCVPSELLEPSFVPQSCTVSALQAEGRCVSHCLAAVAAQPSAFAQDGCGQGQVCAPCYNPLTGSPSGACALGRDPGPTQPAALLGQCCGGLGRCAPSSWIPADQASNFGADSCAGSDRLCVAPSAALSDPAFVPQHCQEPSSGAEGRCLPQCLPQIAAQAGSLKRGSCPDAHLCAPCFNPITGMRTGACNVGTDKPEQPPQVFEACCGASPASASGLCVPSNLLPKDAPSLPRQSCAAENTVCAPRALVLDPKATFPSCASLATDKGVCIESCYLDSLAQLASFQGNCEGGRLCVSCAFLGTVGGCGSDADAGAPAPDAATP